MTARDDYQAASEAICEVNNRIRIACHPPTYDEMEEFKDAIRKLRTFLEENRRYDR